MKEWYTSLLGFVVTPIVSGTLFAIASVLFYSSANGYFLVMLIAGVMYSYLIVAVVAVPLFLLVRFFGTIQWWKATTAGLAIGSVLGVGMASPSAQLLTQQQWYLVAGKNLVLLGVVGALSGLVFWSIWKQGRAKS